MRAGLLQLVFIAVGLGLGLAVPEFTRGPVLPSRPVAEMLLATGFGVLGAATVIFSVLFLVVQWAATTFTPRLTLFRDAPIVWRTFAFAVGLTVFCATAALTIANRDEVSVVVPISAGVLLLLLLTLLRTLLLKAVAAIQLAPVLGSITEQGRHNLDVLYTSGPGDTRGSGGPGDTGDTDHSGGPGDVGGPGDGRGAGDGRGPRGPADPGGPRSAVRWPKAAAVLQRVDVDLLAGAARAANAVVVLRVTPGTTMQHGTTVAEVYDGDLPGSAVLRGLETGAERVFDQDPGLAFRLLADIALRALSPAVNDPATAVQALDAMEDLLRRPARARSREVADRSGVLRVVVPLPGWEDFLRTALDDVIPAARNSPLVLIRLRTLLEDLRSAGHDRDEALLTRRLTWVDEELGARFSRLRDALAQERRDEG
ncbi:MULTISPECIES: DUF2254 family protein [unclassified Streptomyces]|uniref:DUF2254 family protein n=1 Tax=unclassified Streptomyces TaxID=2593676 RepID=UPI0022594074|nr:MULTISPECIES: DUF2254 family protein [unclassified Streptomyces]MCX4988516.1 DUF2254 domain-containing protein [Streptomyces sp. NBC_00568]MCX5006263.1 DUF2254 domain-containing protein [Streptomyces sp. NBC_00638]